MADSNPKNINTVNNVDSIDTQDAIFFSDGGASSATNSGNSGVLRKIDYNKLAKAIIEQYDASQLAGTSQSVKAVLDALNSKQWTNQTSYNGGNLLDYITPLASGTYFVRIDNVQGFPVTGGVVYRINKTNGANDTRCSILAIPMNANSPDIYTAFVPQNATSIKWFNNSVYKQFYIPISEGFAGLDAILDSLTTVTPYIAFVNDDGRNNDRPSTDNAFIVIGHRNTTGQYAQQIAMSFNASGAIYRRTRSNSTTWRDWITMPTRAEVDTLNSKATVNTVRVQSVSLNTLVAAGAYTCQNCTDAPIEGQQWWSVYVVPHGGDGDGNPNYPAQIAVSLNKDDIYIRHCNNGTWSSWVKLPTRAEITPEVLFQGDTSITTANTEVSFSKTVDNYSLLHLTLNSVEGNPTSSRSSCFVLVGDVAYIPIQVGQTAQRLRVNVATNKITFIGTSASSLYICRIMRV